MSKLLMYGCVLVDFIFSKSGNAQDSASFNLQYVDPDSEIEDEVDDLAVLRKKRY